MSFIRLYRCFFVALFAGLLVRVLIVEPFALTTGSMAPAFLGIHRQCDCPKCGLPVIVGAPAKDGDDRHWDVQCPNCGAGHLGLAELPDLPGDRIWVDKNAYEWRIPRRWETVVFRGPDPHATPFVKRVVGLPGESVQIKDGDVYINGEIARKSYEECVETSVLIYDGRYPVAEAWELPADGSVVATATRLHARCIEKETVAKFRASRAQLAPWNSDYCVYNGARVARIETSNDLRVACSLTIAPKSTSGTVIVECGNWPSKSHITLPSVSQYSRWESKLSGQTHHGLVSGTNTTLDIVRYNDGFHIALEGFLPNVWFEQPGHEYELDDNPLVFRILDADVTIDDIRIYRDAHYQSVGRHGIQTPYRLGPDELFVLGDNSANSDDSRFWPTPGVKLSAIIGRPFKRR